MTDTPNILSDPPSEKFEEFRTIINHTTDHGKLENIHSAVNLELGFRLSLPGTYENPDLRDLKPNELVLISKDVVRRMVELIQRQKDLNGELKYVRSVTLNISPDLPSQKFEAY